MSQQFTQHLLTLCDIAQKECDHNPTRFRNMVHARGGLLAAKLVINDPKISDGFTAMYQAQRLDLTVEAQALSERWRALFTPDELRRAEEKLRSVGYKP